MLTLSLLHQSILLSSYNWQAIFAVILDISQEIELPHFLLVWFINNCAAVLLVRTMMNCKSKAYGTGYWYYPVLNLKHSRSNEKISVKIAHHLADYHSNDKMARTRSFLVDVVTLYAMNTNSPLPGHYTDWAIPVPGVQCMLYTYCLPMCVPCVVNWVWKKSGVVRQ